jgi:Amt family ammonium transporter
MAGQVGVQLAGIAATALWSGLLTLVLLKISSALAGLRVSSEEETEGLDTVLHNEKGYNL